MVLKGIVRRGDEYVAFVEDTRSGATSTVRANGSAGEGRVVRLGLDYVEFEKNSRTVKVALGRTLEGNAAGAPAASGSSAAAPASGGTTDAASSSSGAAPAASGENATLELMRQRRQREMNGK